MAVADSKKDEAWHRAYAGALLRWIGNQNIDLLAMQASMNYYNGTQGTEAYRFLQRSEDGSALPAPFVNYNFVKTMVDQLVGEMSKKGVAQSVVALNKEAYSRKQEKRRQFIIATKLRPFFEAIQAETGVDLGAAEFSTSPLEPAIPIPDSLEEIDDYFQRNFKETSEIVLQRVLDAYWVRNKWERLFPQVFRNVPIMGRTFVKVENVNGEPFIRKVDPRCVVFDPNCNDDFLGGAQWIAEVRMVGLSDLAAQYNLSPENIRKLETTSSPLTSNNMLLNAWNWGRASTWNDRYNDGRSVMVLEAQWYDTKEIRFELVYDELGLPVVREMEDDPDTLENKDRYEEVSELEVEAEVDRRDEIIVSGDEEAIEVMQEEKTKFIRRRIRIVRKFVIAEDNVVLEWGEADDTIRYSSNLSECQFSYCGYLPHYIDGRNVSMVHLVKALQDFKNYNYYNITLSIARAGAKGVFYNVDFLPEGYTLNQIIHHLKNSGIVPYSGGDEAVQGSGAMTQAYDLTISNNVTALININAVLEQEIARISGVSPDRMGQVQSGEQAVGVTQIAIVQSSMNTEYLFKGFREFVSEVFTKVVNMAAQNKDVIVNLSDYIGDAANVFLDNYEEYATDYYGVSVTGQPQIVDDRTMLVNFVQTAVQQGAISVTDAFEILADPDPAAAARRLERKIRRKEKEAQQIQMQQMQMQAQQQMQMQQMQNAGAQEVAQTQGAAALERQALANDASAEALQAKTAADVERGLAQREAQVQGKEIDAETRLRVAALQAEARAAQSAAQRSAKK